MSETSLSNLKMEQNTPNKRKFEGESTPNKRAKVERKDYTVTDKKRLLKEYDKLPPGTSKYKAAEALGIKRPFLYKLLDSREKVMSPLRNKNTIHFRGGDNKKVEEACKRWVGEKREQGASISHSLLREKAEMFATQFGQNDWKASLGWSQRFCKRNTARSKKIVGESTAADAQGKVEWLETEWINICKDYTPANIFNADETGKCSTVMCSFFQMLMMHHMQLLHTGVEHFPVL